MGRAHVDLLVGLGFDPSVKNAAAWKHESMCAVSIKHGDLYIAIKRCSRNWLPHCSCPPEINRQCNPIEAIAL